MGLAIGDFETGLAEPLGVIRFGSIEEGLKKVSKVPEASKVSKVILGISEGKMAKEIKEFGNKLQEKLGVPLVFQDETLTTYEAQNLSIEAGIKRKKRRELEDAYSATLILQNYLNSGY